MKEFLLERLKATAKALNNNGCRDWAENILEAIVAIEQLQAQVKGLETSATKPDCKGTGESKQEARCVCCLQGTDICQKYSITNPDATQNPCSNPAPSGKGLCGHDKACHGSHS